jgi:DNA-binding MarR family transcriptional regulator
MRALDLSQMRGREAEQVLDNLRRIVFALYSHSRQVERLAKLTSAQAWLISALARKEPARISDLARSMRLRPSAVIRIVERLESRSLVVRTRASDDHGVAKVALTHLGTKLAERMPAVPQERLLKGLAGISPERLKAVSDGLESLAGILGAAELAPRLFFAPVANLPARNGSVHAGGGPARRRRGKGEGS